MKLDSYTVNKIITDSYGYSCCSTVYDSIILNISVVKKHIIIITTKKSIFVNV